MSNLASEKSLTSIEKAQQICKNQGHNFTPIREKVLSILLQSSEPMSAYDILSEYQKTSQSGAQPPTIYRALSFLSDLGFIHRMASTRQYVICDHIGHHHSHDLTLFFLCDECGVVEETMVSKTFWQEVQEQASGIGLKVTEPCLEVHGVCKKCQNQG